MQHHVASALAGTLLFHDWTEARALWDCIRAAVPGIVSLCLMPDHVHLVTRSPQQEALVRAMRAYARWRNAHRGASGAVWREAPPPEPLVGHQKQERQQRYVDLNPPRKGLTGDPLTWPLATHRERVGLAVDPVRGPDPDPARWHRYVSSDPSVATTGTALPFGRPCPPGEDGVLAVAGAVSAVTRSPTDHLRRRGPVRTLFLRAARELCDAPLRVIGDVVGVRPSAVAQVAPSDPAGVALVARVLGDPRFAPLEPGDLRERPEWWRYAWMA